MYAKGKGSTVPSDGQAREKLALYVYEYLLHIGAQKSAQTFLSEIRWEKNITLGEPPGFLHSWWCVFWELYCAAPDRRAVCEHSSESKAFHDYSAAAAATTSPVMANMPAGDGMPTGPMPPGFFQGPPGSPHTQPPLHNPNATMMSPHNQPFMSLRFPGGLRPPLRMPSQPPVGVPAPQPLLPNVMDQAARPQGHPNVGLMQRMASPRGMMGAAPQNYGGGLRPPPGSLPGPGMTAMNIGPGMRGPWPNIHTNPVSYSSSSPGSYGGPPGTPVMASPGDSTNSSENMYVMNSVGPPGSRPSFSMGPSPEGPMAGMNAMQAHHMNGSVGPGEMDGMPKSSPSSIAAMTNPPGTPHDDGGEIGPSFLNPFQSESYSPSMTMSV
ncbi:single-stranded DNA-binding protein 4 isoform X2 [Elgaria multicarinata webbii]|uniref:single-stranded DNA-binding protein 4 isoform X2 n=1 Tax=Elgaria multicarinata webbii TaxID=159646 RepID=UPI002FCD6234